MYVSKQMKAQRCLEWSSLSLANVVKWIRVGFHRKKLETSRLEQVTQNLP